MIINFSGKERASGVVSELYRDLISYVPEDFHPEIKKLLEEAKSKAEQDQNWQIPVIEAKSQIDETIINGYKTRERLGDGIKILGLYIFPLILLFFLVEGMTGTVALLTGAFFGGLGACLSGIMNFTVHRVPLGEFEPFSSTATRPLIGMTSGVFGVALAASGIFNFGGTNIFSEISITAFILGFSERFVMGTVEKLSTREKTPTKNTANE